MTQSGGQAAGIQLQVGLDLAYFRNQLPLLSKEAAGHSLTFGVRFNRQDIVTQFRTLDRYVNNKNFNIEIKSNLKAEIKAAKELSNLLKSMPAGKPGTPGAIYNRTAGTEVRTAALNKLLRSPGAGGFDATQIKKLAEAAIKAGIEGIDINASATKLRSTLRDAFQQAGDDSSRGLINALTDGRTAVGKAAAGLAEETLNALRTSLQTQSPSKKTEKIGRDVGKGFEIGSVDAMNDAFDALEALTGRRLRKLKAQFAEGARGALAISSGQVSRVSVSDVTPRNFERIAGSSIRGALPPGVDRSAETLQDFYRSLDQIGIALASTIDSSERAADAFKTLRNALDSLIDRAKILASEQSLQARLRPSSVPSGMPLLTGRAPGRALPMLPAAAQRPERFTSQEKLFKDFLGRTIKAVIPESGSAAIGRSLFGGTQFREIGNAMRRPQLGAGIDTKVETVAVKDLTLASRNIAAATDALKAQKLLPAAGGTSASQMIRQVLSGLPPLKAPRIGAQNISPRGSLGQFPMEGMAYPSSSIGSMGRFPMDPMLAVGGASAVGQKIAGPYPFSNTARSARGGYFPGISSSLRFPMEGMIGPSSPIDRITPQSSMFGAGGPPGGPPRPPSGGGGMGGAGSFSRALGGINLPGAGVVREIGSEFAMAAKQVLLFGTAYKALAFLTSFPAQVGQAVGALQSFNNTLKAISPTADEARASNQFILDIVDRYNVPLQSARDGFTKLYASMAPAGFKGDEIRALFTGVSQAAATFGMSADKVDRVNYAFAQMASKGQVMSEELKGQLGDVLPGAMGIFAKAAGFKGTDAIQKFSKALEDGAYKGKPMRDLLKNVSIELTKEFGPGAEGAARTFQGAINRMQNSTKLLYEAFEPVAVGFLNSVVVPLTSGIKTITDGFNAFFTGTQAKTAGGMAFAQELERLKPAFEGIRANVTALMPVLQGFGKTLLEIGKVALQIAGNPLVGYLGRLYLIVLPINMALGVLRGLWASNALQLVIFNARVANGTSTLTAFRGMMAATGATAAITAGKIRAFSIALQAAFSATAVGLVVVGLGMIAEAFMTAGARADAARQKMSQFADSVKQLGAIGDVAGATAEKVGQQALASRLQNAKTLLQQVKAEGRKLTKSQVDELKALQLTGNLEFIEVKRGAEKGLFGVTGKITNLLGTQAALQAEIDSAERGRLETQTRIIQATRAVTEAKKNQTKQETELQEIDLSGGDGAGKPPKEQSLESYYSLQDQLAKAQTQADIDRIQALFDHRKNLINSVYDLEEARANSIQKEAIAHQRAISNIFLDLQKKQIDARLSMMKAEGSVAGGAAPMGAAVSGKTGLFQGSTGVSSGPHFDVRRQDGAYISPEQAKALFDPSVRKQLAMTSAYGPRRAPVPGASTFHKGVDLAGPANTPLNLAAGYAMTGAGEKGGLGYAATVRGPQGEMYDVGHLQRPKAGAMAPQPVAGSVKRDVLADQAQVIAAKQATLSITHAEIEAQRQLVIETEKYLAQIFGIAEKEFQAGMLQKKTAMLRAGATDQEIEDAMSLEELNLKYAAGVEAANRQITFNNQLKEKNLISQEELNDKNAYQNLLIEKLNKELPKATQAQSTLNKASKEYAFTGKVKALQDEIKLLLIINSEERRLAELRAGGLSSAEAQKIVDLEKLKKNIEDARALIDGFVSQTSSDYKGFLKAVISGEDAADALKQFQEGLKDKVLTIFLDFAMAPVEKFLKESLEGLFLPKAPKELKPEEEKAKTGIEGNTVATDKNTTALDNVTAALTGAAGQNQSASTASALPKGFGMSTSLGSAINATDYSSVFKEGSQALTASLTGVFADLSSALDASAYSLSESAVDYSDSFKDIGDNAKDMAKETGEAAEEAGKNGEDMKEALGKTAAGIGIAAGAIMGIAAGVSQIKKGGTGNVLMGIGSIMAGIGGGIGGFTKLFGANGGVAGGGWKPFPVSAFASGGTVKGPTLGLVGEGKYNEAIVPLPDGRSIPVQMRGAGGSGSRDLLANQAQSRSSPSVLSMSFQSTTINGVEYVDRAQLEAAMEETRRAASREGANKGASLAIDRLANSPSSRRRAGIR